MLSIDPRTALAGERTRMAAFRTQKALDRTTLAWLRTTLTMASFGFGMVGFFRSIRGQTPTPENIRLHEGAVVFGGALLILGTVATALAGLSHWMTLRKLARGEPLELNRWPLSITLAFLMTILFASGIWSLFVR
jgi:putative membrane protein